MASETAPLLSRRLLRVLTALFLVMGVFSVALTGGSLYMYYHSTMDRETELASARFEQHLTQLHENLLFHAQLLMRINRWAESGGANPVAAAEMEAQAYKWFHQAGLEILGSGRPEYWVRKGYSESDFGAAISGQPQVFLYKTREGTPRLLLAVPEQRGLGRERTLLFASLRLDDAWLKGIARQIGAEIALCDSSDHVSASSLSLPSTLHAQLGSAQEMGSVITIGNMPYGFRTFPLILQGQTAGNYAVFSPAGPLQSLAFLLSSLIALAFAAALGVTYWIYVSLMKNAGQDIGTLAAWADGYDYTPGHPPPPAGRYREMKALSKAFGSMVTRLDGAMGEIERKNRTLEQDVLDKTREIRSQRDLLTAVVSGLPQGVVLADPEGKILYVNTQAEGPFEIRQGERLKPPLADCDCSLDVASPLAAREFHHEGRDYRLLCHTLENPPRRLLLLEDVTDRHSMEEQLLQSQKLESVSRLAGGVAHDFNNALASIMPCVDMLRLKVEDPKAISYVDSIEKAALRGADIVRQLLAFSRAGDYNPRPLNLNQAVEGAVKLLRPTAKTAVIEWEPGENLPQVFADESQIQQLILNLAINSLDAMNGRGTIRLKTWPGEDRQKVFISVSDTGPGVPPHIAELIFDPFFTTKEQGKGTGLGLSVAYGVVERHKGRIRLTQSEEPGACFEIELPALPVDDASRASGKSKLRGDIVIGG